MISVIIIPTYNEKQNISKLIDKINNLKINNLKILVVDDNSPDGTSKIVKKKKVNLIINKKRIGLGLAYLKAMEYAIKKLNADILIQIDGDLSHDPKSLPDFIKKIKQYDIVLGSRYIKGGSIPKDWNIKRKILSKYGNIFLGIALGNIKIKDWSTGYRAIKKQVYEKNKFEIKDDMFYGYAFQIGFLFKALKYKFKVCEIPINFKDRKYGKSKLGPEYFLNTAKYILKARILSKIYNTK